MYVKKWPDANKLALNVDKTNFVIFPSHTKKLTEPVALKFGLKKITQANHVRFLGVLLDETLSWKPHLVKLCRKLARSVGIFYSMFHVTWNTFKFNRNQLGTVSAYVMSSVPWSNQRAH